MEYILAGLTYWGYACIAPDLPLHGERALGADGRFEYPFFGNPHGIVRAFENALTDAETCAAWLHARYGARAPIGIVGYSLGGCLAILAQANRAGLFQAAVSIVGSAFLAKLVLQSSICADIRDDLLRMGYDEERLAPVLRPVDANEHAELVRDLLMFGCDDDTIVPGGLVRASFETLSHPSNELAMFPTGGHYPSLNAVAEIAVPFLARRF